MISYSNQKEVMDLHDLARFLENEQKVQQKCSSQSFMLGERSPPPYSQSLYWHSVSTSLFKIIF